MRLTRAVVDSHGSATGLARLRAYARLTRWNSAGLAAFPSGIGAVAAGFGTGRTAGAMALGMAVHCFESIVNAVADVDQDRVDPRRGEEALVSGAITMHQAILAALLLLTVIGPATVVVLGRALAVGAYLATVGLYTYANLFQKRSAYLSPVAMDLAFGMVIAGPIVVVALASGRFPAAAVILLAGSMLFQIAGTNVIVGTLKDLACDLAYGVRTSAIALGVRPDDNGVVLSPRFANYVLGLQAGALLLGLVAGVLAGTRGSVDLGLAVLGGILLVAATLKLVSLVRRASPLVTSVTRPWSTQADYLATVAIAAAALGSMRVLVLFGAVLALTALSVTLSGNWRTSIDRLLRMQDATADVDQSPSG